jgi:hypothetical protein
MEIIASVLPMKLDLYVQSDTQDPDTGAINKTWDYYTTVDCHAKGIVSNSTSTRANDIQSFSNRYSMDQMIQIRTEQKLNVRHKITNIRNKNGSYIWTELNYPTETPTVFEVIGVTPITDPFGTVLAYSTTAKRSENQVIGI